MALRNKFGRTAGSRKSQLAVFILFLFGLNLIFFQNCGRIESTKLQSNLLDGDNTSSRSENSEDERSAQKIELIRAPGDQQLYQGDNIDIKLLARSQTPIVYSWSKDGVEIPAIKGNVLSLSDLEIEDSGRYQVKLTHAFSPEVTAEFQLSVVAPPATNLDPTFVTFPENQIFAVGADALLEFSTMGYPRPSIRWFFNDELIPEATDSFLYLENLQPDQSGRYQVEISSDGKTQTKSFMLFVEAPGTGPFLVSEPKDQTVMQGQALSLEVDVMSLQPLSFQWLKNDQNLVNQTEQKLSLSSATLNDSGKYSVKVSTPQGDLVQDINVQVVCPRGFSQNNAQNQCVQTKKSCVIANGMGQQTFASGSYSVCVASTCNQGFSLSPFTKSCLPTVTACTVANGEGRKVFSNGKYGACQIVRCNEGFRPGPDNRCRPTSVAYSNVVLGSSTGNAKIEVANPTYDHFSISQKRVADEYCRYRQGSRSEALTFTTEVTSSGPFAVYCHKRVSLCRYLPFTVFKATRTQGVFLKSVTCRI